MTGTSKAELSLILAAPTPQTATAPAPKLESDPASTRAIKHCMAAWRRSFNAYMENSGGGSMDRVVAAHEAGKAYRNAMPLLSSYEGIRDFIACTAHGILIGAILPQQSGHILYAAQVALSTLQCDPKPRKSGSV